ncbi:MAG: HAD family hydrolase [Bulleidia sp.]
MIRAVLFDFDDALGNREEYAYRFFRDIIEQNTDIKDPLEKEAVLQDLMLWDEHGNIRKTHITDMLKEKYGITLPYENFRDYWNEHLWEYTVPFDGAKETLEKLKDGFQLGIITNGPSKAQRNKLEKSGLAEFFHPEHVIVSGDYGYHKPDRRLFEEAAARLGVNVDECVFVGDIFTNDVYGALKAGMKAVWIWNGRRRCSLDIPVIHDIRELPDILESIITGN